MKIYNYISGIFRLKSLVCISLLLVCACSVMAEFAASFKGGIGQELEEKYYIVHKTSWQKSKYGRNYNLSSSEYTILKEELKLERTLWGSVMRATAKDYSNDPKIKDDDRVKKKKFNITLWAPRKMTLKAGPVKTRAEAEAKLDEQDDKRIKYMEKKAKKATERRDKYTGKKKESVMFKDKMERLAIQRGFVHIKLNMEDQKAKYFAKRGTKPKY